MFFHRGLRLRPELTSFRLGVQKTQEAIEKTIGGCEKPSIPKSNKISTKDKPSGNSNGVTTSKPTNTTRQRPKTSKLTFEKREARKLLGELCVDKEYLENLLKNPDLKRADTGAEGVAAIATDAVRYLNTRQEFWRQQRPCTALPKKKTMQFIN